MMSGPHGQVKKRGRERTYLVAVRPSNDGRCAGSLRLRSKCARSVASDFCSVLAARKREEEKEEEKSINVRTREFYKHATKKPAKKPSTEPSDVFCSASLQFYI